MPLERRGTQHPQLGLREHRARQRRHVHLIPDFLEVDAHRRAAADSKKRQIPGMRKIERYVGLRNWPEPGLAMRLDRELELGGRPTNVVAQYEPQHGVRDDVSFA